MPAFSPGLGSVGLSPFTDFAAGLPTLCTPGLVKDGVVPSPIMREVMMHHGSDDSPLHVFRQPLLHVRGEHGGTKRVHYDPFGPGGAKEAAGDGQAQDGNTSFDGGKGSASEGAPREHKPCSCKKSRCLKKYCECFSASKYCEGCYCTACENNPDGKPKHAVGSPSGGSQGVVPVQNDATQSGMPSTSIPSPVERDGSPSLLSKGCRCKKSRCQKKYCDCFQTNTLCTGKCECHDCKNRTWDDRSPEARQRGVQPKKRARTGGRVPMEPIPMAATMDMVGAAMLSQKSNSLSPNSELDITIGACGDAMPMDTPRQPMLHQGQPVFNPSMRLGSLQPCDFQTNVTNSFQIS